MDVGDAVVFRPDMVDADGVLAVVPLSAHMVKLLEVIPLDVSSLPDMPFRSAGRPLECDSRNWWLLIKRVLRRQA